jgi:hypothetical protein
MYYGGNEEPMNKKSPEQKKKASHNPKKLKLNKDTLRDLTDRDRASDVKGGAIVKNCSAFDSGCAAT